MFTCEEMMILEEMELLSLPVEICVERLRDNLNNVEDAFTKEFLREMILKIEGLTKQEYFDWIIS